jgi:hypothetical protein
LTGAFVALLAGALVGGAAATPSDAAPAAVDGIAAAAPAGGPSGSAAMRLADAGRLDRGGPWPRPPVRPDWYRAGALAGASEAGAIVGADAILGAGQPPQPDPSCAFPSQQLPEMSAGTPPCNFCANPPCN